MKFNIFKIAGIYESEEIHTRIIAELINPHSKFHKNGQHFLYMFLETIKDLLKLNPMDFNGAFVKTEVQTSEGRRIDMVISNDKYYIPFEVKIRSKDLLNQIVDYYEFSKQKGIVPKIVYLTPTGCLPSTKSRGNLPDSAICCISFKEHILPWLDKCIASDVSQDILQILQQLRDNINDDFKLVRNETDSLLNTIQSKLAECNIIWTECTSTYLTLRLNKKGLLEFALRIRVDRKNKIQVKLQIICGVEQANGIPNYSNTYMYISNNYDEFMALLKETFTQALHVKTDPNKWARFEETLELSDGKTENEFGEECYTSICQILDSCINSSN